MISGTTQPVPWGHSHISFSPSTTPFPSNPTAAGNSTTTTPAHSLANFSNSFQYQSFATIPTSMSSHTPNGNGNHSFREALNEAPGPAAAMTSSGYHGTDTDTDNDTEMESDTEMDDDITPRNSIKSIGSFVGVASGASATPATELVQDEAAQQQDEEDSQYYNHYYYESQPSQARCASPVPTEIDDPEPEYLEQQLVMRGAKIKDFAYEKPDPALVKIPELWDQYEGIAEYEYRLAQSPRVYPITGRTTHRLIELGWVDREEVEARCASMDLDELRDYEAGQIWPWTLKYKTAPKCTERPSESERTLHMLARRWIYVRLDKMRRTAELKELKKLKEKAEVEEAIKKGQEVAMSKRKGKKRVLEEDDDQEDELDADGDVECDDPFERSPKTLKRRSRRRTKKTNWDEELDLEYDYGDKQKRGSPFGHLPSPPPMPVKQYPAPLFSYDPQLYPEAASAIEFQQSQSQQYNQQMSQHYGHQSYLQQSQAAAASSSQQQQQPYSTFQQYQQEHQTPAASGSQSSSQQHQPLPAYQPVYSLYPARPVHDKERPPVERSDTPPLDEEDDRPNKLVRPAKRGLGRGLSRTQTFTQL